MPGLALGGLVAPWEGLGALLGTPGTLQGGSGVAAGEPGEAQGGPWAKNLGKRKVFERSPGKWRGSNPPAPARAGAREG